MYTKRFILHSLLIITGMASVQSLLANKSAKKDAEFIAAHLLPDGPLKEELDAAFASTRRPKKAFKNSNFLYLKKDHTHILMHPKEPGLLIKFVPTGTSIIGVFSARANIGRVLFADKIAQLIEKHQLQNITVPKKWLYHIPGTKDDLDDSNYLVVAEKLDVLEPQANAIQWRGINTDQEEEMRFIINEIGFHDVLPENICFTSDYKLAFIDTEPRWTPMLRNSVFRSVRKSLLGSKGLSNLDDLLSKMKKEVTQYHQEEIHRLQVNAKPAVATTESLDSERIFDIADVCAAALHDDECDIETTDEVVDAFACHVMTRGGGDLTRFERCDNAIDGKPITATRLDLNEGKHYPAPSDDIDFTIPTRIILLEHYKPPCADPVSDELFTGGTQELTVHDILSLDCLSL